MNQVNHKETPGKMKSPVDNSVFRGIGFSQDSDPGKPVMMDNFLKHIPSGEEQLYSQLYDKLEGLFVSHNFWRSITNSLGNHESEIVNQINAGEIDGSFWISTNHVNSIEKALASLPTNATKNTAAISRTKQEWNEWRSRPNPGNKLIKNKLPVPTYMDPNSDINKWFDNQTKYLPQEPSSE